MAGRCTWVCRATRRHCCARGTSCLIHQPRDNLFDRQIECGQALAWVLRHPGMSSVLIGASRPQQVRDAVGAATQLGFDAQTLAAIEAVLAGG